MRFSSPLFTALLSATALANPILANPIDTNTLAARDKTLDEKIGGDADAWNGYAAYCGGQSAKMARDPSQFMKRKPNAPIPMSNEITVGQQNSMGGGIPIGFWTWDLVTCLGVVVVGHEKGDKNKLVRAMKHFTADQFSFESQWNDFETMVSKLNMEKDGSDAYMSAPDPDTETPEGTWTDGKKKLAKDIESALKDKLDKMVDGDCKVVHRYMRPLTDGLDGRKADHNDINGIMYVDGQNAVSIAGKIVS
jgi:hypothetical protein